MHAKTRSNRHLVIALGVVCLLLAGCLLALFLKKDADGDNTADDTAPMLSYADGVTVVNDPDALQKAVDDMYAKAAEGNIALEYDNDARSEDGETFSCYIANSSANSYDMYVQIFADSALTDQLLLTGLVRPGNAFKEITLEHSLDPGDHRVYVAFTQVEDDLATIHGQIIVTMDFHVTD